MPELPEVETVRATLDKLVTGKSVEEVEVLWPKMIKKPADAHQFAQLLIGETIQKVSRRGKFLLFYFDHVVLISHLRMEGRFGLHEQEEPFDKHTHVFFKFSDKTQLRYRDVRKFGTMHIFPIGGEMSSPPLMGLGPEPFSNAFTTDYFFTKLTKTDRKIKPVLLDQTIVVGLGNIYVDEALFRAKIHPERKANSLTQAETKRLKREIIETLKEAVEKGGSTVRSYVNSQGQIGMFQLAHHVYGKKGEACVNCGSEIEKIKLGGRGTHFCPKCQIK